MPQLTRRKRKQLERFLPNPGKGNPRLTRLVSQARVRKRLIKSNVLRLKLGKEETVLKVSSHEMAQRANLARLFRTHRDLVEKRIIQEPKTYVLEKTKYLYTTNNTSITKLHEGIGIDTLEDVLAGSKYDTHPEKAEILKFILKHPKITISKLKALRNELTENLIFITLQDRELLYDLYGINNVIIKGIDDKTGRLRIGLVDQVLRYHERTAHEALDRLKQKHK